MLETQKAVLEKSLKYEREDKIKLEKALAEKTERLRVIEEGPSGVLDLSTKLKSQAEFLSSLKEVSYYRLVDQFANCTRSMRLRRRGRRRRLRSSTRKGSGEPSFWIESKTKRRPLLSNKILSLAANSIG